MSRSTAIQQKIAEKKANLEQLREFKQSADQLANELEQIGDYLEVMKDGTTNIAYIVAKWQSVMRAISLASIALVTHQSRTGETPTYPEPLVRIKLSEEEEKFRTDVDVEDGDEGEREEGNENEDQDQDDG
ncbi:uncharacterized protein LODBEIA_P04750 [Lodderomyces beijingensis]|uniref:DASH complex subunit DAD2 n=1 Tax=Lodderomyces beijingensis TaxID=1775926 RepID=A0ABP0ZDK5_9ASCO